MGRRPYQYTNNVYYVYYWCMSRTNIDIDDRALEIVMRRYGIHTKTAAVELALRRLVGEPLTIAEALALQGAHLIDVVPADPPSA